MAQRPTPRGASFAYSVSLRRLDDQLGRISALDTKVGILMAVEGVVASLLLGSDSLLITAPATLSTLIAALAMASLLSALLSFTNRRYETAPEPRAVVRFMSQSEDWLKWRFLRNFEVAIGNNDKKLKRKARFFTISITLLIVALLLLGAYFIQGIVRGTIGATHAG